MSHYVVYDVFTDLQFGGNPLAVVMGAENIGEQHLQSIAREFNFSETTFVFPPDKPAHTARVRIFTPTTEIPFAGHPTIGTAICLHDMTGQSALTLELGVGPIPCTVTAKGAAFTTAVPLTTSAHPALDLVARSLSISHESITTDTHAPVQAGVGLPFTFVELRDRGTLAACRPDIAAIREAAEMHPSDMHFNLFAYCRNGSTISARMFSPLDNIPEDPATGSACAALAALLRDVSGEDQDLHFRQGEDMGRPSLIRAAASLDPANVTISGQARRVMSGQLHLD